MTPLHDDERENLPDRVGGSTIPGAWAQPASAFVDESRVVRPDRPRADPGDGRLARLLVLAALSAATAGFAWGVTVALQGLDDDPELPPVELASASPSPTPGALPPPTLQPAAVRSVDEAESEPSAPAATGLPAATPAPNDEEAGLPVPAADPTFPRLPAALPGADDAAAAATEPPKERLRPAQRALDEDRRATKKQRHRRLPRKGQPVASAPDTAKAKAKPTTTTVAAPGPAAPGPAAPGPAAPGPAPGPDGDSAKSLTLEAEKLFAAGKLAPARALAERAVKVGQAYPRAHRTLAVICAKQGDGGCARKGYERYLKLAPDAPDAPDVRRILGM